MGDVTVLTLVPNAGDRLRKCLESVGWASDVFCVVDPNTTDGSDAVAREFTDHVVVHEYVNKAEQVNWALPQIATEWTLVLDADEWVSPELAKEIQVVTANASARDGSDHDGYFIKRVSYFFGKRIEHCGWDRDYNLRMFRTKKSRYEDRRVHASVEVEGSVGHIHQAMYHDTYRSFEEYFATFHRFTTWSAQDLFDQGRRARIRDLVLRPPARFFKMYVLRRGFLDGAHGAVLCGLAAFSVFMKYAKLWRLHLDSAADRR